MGVGENRRGRPSHIPGPVVPGPAPSSSPLEGQAEARGRKRSRENQVCFQESAAFQERVTLLSNGSLSDPGQPQIRDFALLESPWSYSYSGSKAKLMGPISQDYQMGNTALRPRNPQCKGWSLRRRPESCSFIFRNLNLN